MEPDAILERPRLERRLDDVMTRRLGLVIAGAGYGKSTLAAAWAADRSTAWCALDAGARDVRVLARRLFRALDVVVPGLPSELEAAAQRVGADGEDEAQSVRADRLAALVCESLEARLEDDLVIVIDDLHELPAEDAGLRFIEGLVRGAPPRLHLLITSRWPMPFPIERLRGQGQVVELSGGQLRFDRDELAALLEGLDPPAPHLVEALQARTEGWPALVRLVIESMRDEPVDERERVVDRLGEPTG
ncbi:MAG TPA: AAA family ATPase, partial [Candidatus Limnocylindrales bacterium]